VPKKFLEKIIQDLIRCGLIKSKRGARGGYSIARSPERISFSDVITECRKSFWRKSFKI
jgi:Rrf2 family protein